MVDVGLHPGAIPPQLLPAGDRELTRQLDHAQLKGLAFRENGFRNLTKSVRPVRTPEDVKELKVRTMENQVHIEAWRVLGAVPAAMAWSEVYGALQQWVVDAEENPIAVVYASKRDEVQRYLSLTQHLYSRR